MFIAPRLVLCQSLRQERNVHLRAHCAPNGARSKYACRAIDMLLLRSNAGCDSVITAGEGADDQ